LAIQLADERLELASLDAKTEIADAFAHQFLPVFAPAHSLLHIVRPIASSTMRSIMSPYDSSGFDLRAAIANSALLSSHGFGFTSMMYGVPSAASGMSMRA